MDRLLGGIIDDITLYRIIEGVIIIFILFAVFSCYSNSVGLEIHKQRSEFG